MRKVVVAAVLVSSSVAFADLPTREQQTLAKQLAQTVASLTPRLAKLETQVNAVKESFAKAGVRFEDEYWERHKQERVPTADDVAAMDAAVQAVETEANALVQACTTYHQGLQKLGIYTSTSEGPFRSDLEYAEQQCKGYQESLHQPVEACGQWRQLGVAFFPKGKCSFIPKRTLAALPHYKNWRRGWEREQEKEKAQQAKDDVLTTAVSGNPRQRAVVIPRKFGKNNADNTRLIVDTLGLFAAAHPSHFVFLRKDLAGAPRASGESTASFTRKLKKGEAVLPLRGNMASGNDIGIITIDGNRGVVRVEDLAVAPLPGTKVVVLKAEDLNVTDDKGTVLAGPTWLLPDATGFNLEEPNGWLELLDPPEPRTQKFLESKEKVVACYGKQMERLDPNGTLRKYYDVVTYGRGGIQKVESAAVNFDRKACGACGCKAFNANKAKLIKAAIAPAQKTAFEAYVPVLEQLKKTDFAAASKGAPKGDDSWVPQAK